MKPHIFAGLVTELVRVTSKNHGEQCMRALVAKCLRASGITNRSRFRRGDRVRKKSGSAWQGIVVGEYSTSLTPEGYAVESEAHPGSVQIYPAAALELVKE